MPCDTVICTQDALTYKNIKRRWQRRQETRKIKKIIIIIILIKGDVRWATWLFPCGLLSISRYYVAMPRNMDTTSLWHMLKTRHDTMVIEVDLCQRDRPRSAHWCCCLDRMPSLSRSLSLFFRAWLQENPDEENSKKKLGDGKKLMERIKRKTPNRERAKRERKLLIEIRCSLERVK